jgi:hypothetical protein
MSAQEIALEDELVEEFFKKRSQKVPALVMEPLEESFSLDLQQLPALPVLQETTAETPSETVMRKNFTLPRDKKPLPGEMPSIEVLRAQAKARREQKIAERVARYNTVSLPIINDIR